MSTVEYLEREKREEDHTLNFITRYSYNCSVLLPCYQFLIVPYLKIKLHYRHVYVGKNSIYRVWYYQWFSGIPWRSWNSANKGALLCQC